MSLVATECINVYLAGGMRSNWQDKVKSAFCHEHIFDGKQCVRFLDPRDWNYALNAQFSSEERSQTVSPAFEKAYTDKDINGINQSSILIGYLEETNVSGAGLALELGYARAMGKTIYLLIDEKHPSLRYWGMARALADQWFIIKNQSDFDETILSIAHQISVK